jgi:hypothetical protein
MRVCAHRADPALAAVVVRQAPLHYADGADPAMDRPAHVRAGSSLARVPGGIAVIQDDAARWAVLRDVDGSPYTGKVEGLLEAQDRQSDLFAVVDADDAGTPSMLCEVELHGPWFTAGRSGT